MATPQRSSTNHVYKNREDDRSRSGLARADFYQGASSTDVSRHGRPKLSEVSGTMYGTGEERFSPVSTMHALVVLSYANAVGEAVVFWRLVELRVLSRYKWFAVWMAFSAVRDFSILVATDAHFTSSSFWTLWKLTEPIALGLVVLVSFEVYDLITSTYKTLGSVGVKVLKVALMLGIGVSFVLILVDWRDVTPWIFLVKRIVTLLLAISLMYVSWVFLWATGPIRPNVIRHCRILTVYLSSVAGGYFLLNLGLQRVLSGLLYMSFCLGCLVAWTILLTRDGEKVPTADGIPNGYVMNDDQQQYPRKNLSGLARDRGDAIL